MARGGAWASSAAVVVLWWLAAGAGAVWLEIAPSATKCVSQEIQSNLVVIGDYSVLYEHHYAHPTVSVKMMRDSAGITNSFIGTLVGTIHPLESTRGECVVSLFVTSPFGDTVHKRERVSVDQFAFTTAEAGNYLACFTVDGENKGLLVKLNLDWKIGIGAKDWDSVAKREKLEGVELELVKLQAAVQAIHENLLLLRSKEADMTDVNEKTNARISWLSMMSLSVCIIVSVLQLWQLQKYFRKKKLI